MPITRLQQLLLLGSSIVMVMQASSQSVSACSSQAAQVTARQQLDTTCTPSLACIVLQHVSGSKCHEGRLMPLASQSICMAVASTACSNEAAVLRIMNLESMHACTAACTSLSCLCAQGSSLLAVWGPAPGLGTIHHIALADAGTCAVTAVVRLQAPISQPQWGFGRMAATAADGSLVLYAHGAGGTLQLLAALPAVLPLPVARGQQFWPGLTTFAWSSRGRWLAAVLAPTSADADLALVLLDGNRAGRVVWSYSLRGTSGAASPGVHNLSWSADGSALSMCIAARFARKFNLSFLSPHGCCEEACRGAQYGLCPEYEHAGPGGEYPDLSFAFGSGLGLF